MSTLSSFSLNFWIVIICCFYFIPSISFCLLCPMKISGRILSLPLINLLISTAFCLFCVKIMTFEWFLMFSSTWKKSLRISANLWHLGWASYPSLQLRLIHCSKLVNSLLARRVDLRELSFWDFLNSLNQTLKHSIPYSFTTLSPWVNADKIFKFA